MKDLYYSGHETEGGFVVGYAAQGSKKSPVNFNTIIPIYFVRFFKKLVQFDYKLFSLKEKKLGKKRHF